MTRLEQIKLDIELRQLRYPVKAVADRTGFDRGNVSKYLSGRLRLSDKFTKAFYKVFDKDLKDMARKMAEGQPCEFLDGSQVDKSHRTMQQIDMLSNLIPCGKNAENLPINVLLRNITKLVENNCTLVEGNIKLVSATEKLVKGNKDLVDSLIRANKRTLR
ncbi:MAG TPA: hypothetical protein VGN00_20275 [Puia sp.]|jgi:hypothetical protein